MKGKGIQRLRMVAATLILAGLAVWSAGSRRNSDLLSATAAELNSQDQLHQLLHARHETAARLLQMEEKRLREGVTTLGHVCEVARWVRDSAVELPSSAGERLPALTNYVALTRRLEESLDRATGSGAASLADKESARYLRLDAEVTMLRAKQQAGR